MCGLVGPAGEGVQIQQTANAVDAETMDEVREVGQSVSIDSTVRREGCVRAVSGAEREVANRDAKSCAWVAL